MGKCYQDQVAQVSETSVVPGSPACPPFSWSHTLERSSAPHQAPSMCVAPSCWCPAIIPWLSFRKSHPPSSSSYSPEYHCVVGTFGHREVTFSCERTFPTFKKEKVIPMSLGFISETLCFNLRISQLISVMLRN